MVGNIITFLTGKLLEPLMALEMQLQVVFTIRRIIALPTGQLLDVEVLVFDVLFQHPTVRRLVVTIFTG